MKDEEGVEYLYYSKDNDWITIGDSLYFFTKSEKYPIPLYSHSSKPVIDWQITDETQVIAGYIARKAIGKSLYDEAPNDPYGQAVAWFTTDIPLPYGPDGYGGLPGLIVKLEYSARKKSYKTTLERIEYKAVEKWQLPPTTGKVEISLDQVYNPWKLDEKWLKAKQKELKL
jgi:GLPGLI family protein